MRVGTWIQLTIVPNFRVFKGPQEFKLSTAYSGILVQINPLQLVGQAAEFKFKSKFKPLPVIWQLLLNYIPEDNWRSFDCKISGRALRAALLHRLHSLHRSNRHAKHGVFQSQGQSLLAATCSCEEKMLPLLWHWLSSRLKKVLLLWKFWALTTNCFSMWNEIFNGISENLSQTKAALIALLNPRASNTGKLEPRFSSVLRVICQAAGDCCPFIVREPVHCFTFWLNETDDRNQKQRAYVRKIAENSNGGDGWRPIVTHISLEVLSNRIGKEKFFKDWQQIAQ